ncbi:MAG TPA: hypothetical protein VJB08_03230 [Candidatus Nanoarchaeia archaeon]|nr:hypothetical protein [Candidatus Nanoarchaeia archaeon]
MDWHHRLEELFLGLLIALNILDFTHQLPGDLDILKKILSWASVVYLFYKASLTTILFGEGNKVLDFTLVMTYLFLAAKNLIFIADQASSLWFGAFFSFLSQHASTITILSIMIGALLLLIHAAVLAEWSSHIAPGPGLLKRFFAILLALFAFFVVVFNFFMEWISLSVDAPLLLITLLFYFFTLYQRQWEFFRLDSFLYRVGEASTRFYEQFTGLFSNRRTLMLGLAGMLVLHLLVDGGIYLIPYITGLENPLYAEILGPGHSSILSRFSADTAYVSGPMNLVLLIWAYFFNVVFLAFVLGVPAYLWWSAYRNKHPPIPLWLFGLFFASLATFALSPIFSISSISTDAIVGSSLIGVDIQTHQLFGASIPPLKTAFFASLFFLAAAPLVSTYWPAEKRVLDISLWVFDFFVAVYVYIFLRTLLIYATHPQGAIPSLWASGQYFVMAYLVLFFGIASLFYVAGFVSYMVVGRRWEIEEDLVLAGPGQPMMQHPSIDYSQTMQNH